MAIDQALWRWVTLRFVPWLAVLSLIWEWAHLPLYTLWRDATPGYLAFVVAHCTVGDILIGTSALLLSLLFVPTPTRTAVIVGMVAITVAYTVFSEWLNTSILENWAYSGLMPVLLINSTALGLSPIFQALLVPPAALAFAGYRQLASL